MFPCQSVVLQITIMSKPLVMPWWKKSLRFQLREKMSLQMPGLERAQERAKVESSQILADRNASVGPALGGTAAHSEEN